MTTQPYLCHHMLTWSPDGQTGYCATCDASWPAAAVSPEWFAEPKPPLLAGIALDALIDEKVFGYTWQPVDPDHCAGPTVTHRLYQHGVAFGHIRATRHTDGRVVPLGGREYSVDHRAMWHVVEAMQAKGWNATLHRTWDGYTAEFDHEGRTHRDSVDPREGGMPLAVCRAALAAVAPDSPPGAPVPASDRSRSYPDGAQALTPPEAP